MCIVFLVWNIILSVQISKKAEIVQNGTSTSVQNTVHGYATEVTGVVENAETSLVKILGDEGRTAGNGILFAKDGNTVYVFTTCEAVSSETHSVQFASGLSVNAELVGMDEETDLALLTVVPSFDVQVVKTGDISAFKKGEYGIACGAHNAQTDGLQVTFGVVSKREFLSLRDNAYQAEVLMTDAQVNSENDGGGLFNVGGELLGILSNHVSRLATGMSCAISVNEMQLVYKDLKQGGTVGRGVLGVVGSDLSDWPAYEKSAAGISLDSTTGVYVTSVSEGSAAHGILRQGDVILGMDGEDVKTMNDLHAMLYEKESGQTVSLHVLSGGQETDVSVVLQ